MKTAQAILKMMRVSPRKLNLVAQSIRGMKADKALRYLAYSPKRIAKDVRKAVLSAVANAENNNGMDIDRLYIHEAHVGKNMTLNRFHPRGRGRSAPIKKLFSQLSVIVVEKEV